MPDPDKRELRQLKREIKRVGSQHRRRELKRSLAEHPEEAVDDVPSVGKYVSARLNGLDLPRDGGAPQGRRAEEWTKAVGLGRTPRVKGTNETGMGESEAG